MVKRSHRDGADLAQIVVGRDQVDAVSRERVQIDRERRGQCFTFARLHLSDAAIVKHHGADELDIEGPHFQTAVRGFATDGEGFGEHRIKGDVADLALLDTVKRRPFQITFLAFLVKDLFDAGTDPAEFFTSEAYGLRQAGYRLERLLAAAENSDEASVD